MAGGMDLGQSGGRGRKPLDTAINLVPFIDLMAVTISFLIMTAVWSQVGRLQVGSAGQAEAAPQEPAPALTLVVTPRELSLLGDGAPVERYSLARDERGRWQLSKLQEQLKGMRSRFATLSNISFRVEDAVRYEDLIRLVDGCVEVGLENVSIESSTG